MLGPPKVRDLDRPVLASLDAPVPKDNVFRHLETVLDLSFVRDWVKDCYSHRMAPLRPEAYRARHVFCTNGDAGSGGCCSLATHRLRAV